MANVQLEESNRMLLGCLSVAQDNNRKLQEKIKELEMMFKDAPNVGLGKMWNLRKIKDEKSELCEREKKKHSLVSKKLNFPQNVDC